MIKNRFDFISKISKKCVFEMPVWLILGKSIPVWLRPRGGRGVPGGVPGGTVWGGLKRPKSPKMRFWGIIWVPFVNETTINRVFK